MLPYPILVLELDQFWGSQQLNGSLLLLCMFLAAENLTFVHYQIILLDVRELCVNNLTVTLLM